MRRLWVLTLFAIIAVPLWAQDASEQEEAAEEAPPAETTESTEDSAADSIEDEDILDELYSEEDDDKFIPSEDVAFGQSIPFPTDI
ncbi:MAG: hypothetical protein KJO09_14155 [Gammaproteobacteria bacterium]|nr:hypothetical protein [Gammaproteobacteria bacterium]